MDEGTKHQYGQAIAAVVLAALVSGVAGLYNRIERIDARIPHKDYLEQRLKHIEFRLENLEKYDGP